MTTVDLLPPAQPRSYRGLVPIGAAARHFGVSEPTLRSRLREFRIALYVDPLDRRRRLVRLADLKRFPAVVEGSGNGGMRDVS